MPSSQGVVIGMGSNMSITKETRSTGWRTLAGRITRLSRTAAIHRLSIRAWSRAAEHRPRRAPVTEQVISALPYPTTPEIWL